MKFNYFITALIGLFSIGCAKQEPDFFVDTHFIKFKFDHSSAEYHKQSYNFSMGSETATEYEYTFPVELSGRDLDKTLFFAAIADLEKTTLPTDCYSIPSNQPFRSGIGKIDSVRIKLFRKPILREGVKILRLQLIESPDFQLFMPDSSYIELTVTDIFTRPAWWDETVEKAYLGKYSRTKYNELGKETGIYDFTPLDASEKRHYAILFKRALEKKPRQDEDGSWMSVTIPG